MDRECPAHGQGVSVIFIKGLNCSGSPKKPPKGGFSSLTKKRPQCFGIKREPISTPTAKKTSKIAAGFKRSTQEASNASCPACGVSRRFANLFRGVLFSGPRSVPCGIAKAAEGLSAESKALPAAPDTAAPVCPAAKFPNGPRCPSASDAQIGRASCRERVWYLV